MCLTPLDTRLPMPYNSQKVRQRPDRHHLRVMFFSDAVAGRNGVGTYYDDLITHLAPRIAAAELVSPGTGETGHTWSRSLPLPGDKTQRLYLPRLSGITAVFHHLGPHVVVAATPGPYGLTGCRLARRHRVPLLAGHHTQFDQISDLYWHNAAGTTARWVTRQINAYLFRRACAVIGNSEKMTAEARRLKAGEAVMMGTPVAPPFLEDPIPPPPRQVSSVCFAGRLAPEKNIRSVLAAARNLPDIRFTIAGDGPLGDEVRFWSRRLSNLTYAGWVSREGVRAVIDHSDMLLLPSRVESFGTIALEALARRRRVLVSPECGILNWPDLALGVDTPAPGETLTCAIRRIAGSSEDNKRRPSSEQIPRRFNEKTLQQWLHLLTAAAGKAV